MIFLPAQVLSVFLLAWAGVRAWSSTSWTRCGDVTRVTDFQEFFLLKEARDAAPLLSGRS